MANSNLNTFQLKQLDRAIDLLSNANCCPCDSREIVQWLLDDVKRGYKAPAPWQVAPWASHISADGGFI